MVYTNSNSLKTSTQNSSGFNAQKSHAAKSRKRRQSNNVFSRVAYICSIVLLGVIFLTFIIGCCVGNGYKKENLFKEDMLAVQNQEGKWGYINKTGQTMIGFDFDNAFSFSENGRALVSKDGKWGYIDASGKMVIAAEYDVAMPFDFDVAIVKKDGKYGLIDRNGNVVSKNPDDNTAGFYFDNIFEFEQEYSSKNVYAVAVLDGKYGLIDRNGNVVIDFKYDDLGYVDENIGETRRIGNKLISYKLDEGWGYVDYEGKEISNPIYDLAYSFDDNGWAIVYENNEYWIVYLGENDRLIDAYHDIYSTNFIDRFENGYYRIQNNENLYGLITKNPDTNADVAYVEAVKTEYTYLEYGNDELLIYSKNTDPYDRNYGYMNYKGETLTDEIYLSAKVAGDKLVTTKENSKHVIETTVLNTNMTVAFTIECDEGMVFDFNYGVAVFEKDKKFGYVREDGKIIVDATLLFADEFKADGFAVARNDDGYGVLNSKGKWQIGAIYSAVSHFALNEV